MELLGCFVRASTWSKTADPPLLCFTLVLRTVFPSCNATKGSVLSIHPEVRFSKSWPCSALHVSLSQRYSIDDASESGRASVKQRAVDKGRGRARRKWLERNLASEGTFGSIKPDLRQLQTCCVLKLSNAENTHMNCAGKGFTRQRR